MSLRGQFFLSVVLALGVAVSVEATIACLDARRSVENEMHKALDASDRIVDNALLSLPAGQVDPYLARLVRSFDGNRHIWIQIKQAGHVLGASHIAPPEKDVPHWFLWLLEIPVETRQDYSPRLPGRMILVLTDPHNEISETWVQFRDGALILMLFSILVLGLLHLAMSRTALSLGRLSAGFDALGGGDYAVRVAPRGPREIAYLARAFNRMAGRLGSLEDTNRRLNGQMLDIQEEERADLARDLHDEMAPFLFAVRVDAQNIASLAAEAGGGVIADRARAIGEAVNHMQQHVRSILDHLRPPEAGEVALAQAIGNLVTFWQRHNPGIAIALDIDCARHGFGAETDRVVFRLIQEALTNAARHGKAHKIWIALAADARRLNVTVEDDGVGVSPDMESVFSDGLGLKGMRERLAPLLGRLTLVPRPGGGTRLAAEIPRLRQDDHLSERLSAEALP